MDCPIRGKSSCSLGSQAELALPTEELLFPRTFLGSQSAHSSAREDVHPAFSPACAHWVLRHTWVFLACCPGTAHLLSMWYDVM